VGGDSRCQFFFFKVSVFVFQPNTVGHLLSRRCDTVEATAGVSIFFLGASIFWRRCPTVSVFQTNVNNKYCATPAVASDLRCLKLY
jgi:hypothetical protein